MKKVAIIMSLAVMSMTLLAQGPVERVFTKYSQAEGVTRIQISRGMMNMLSNVDNDDEAFKALVRSINSINILHAPQTPGGNGKIDFYREIAQDLPAGKYNELMRVNSPEQNILFLVEENGGLASEFLVVVGGAKENVLISIKGNLDMSKLASLSAINAPGMNHLMNLQK
jgi:hypothetical protein